EVSARTDAYDAAIAFLKFFSNQENQVMWAEGGAFSPVEGAMAAANHDPHTQNLAALFDGARELVSPPDTGSPVEIADAYHRRAGRRTNRRPAPRLAVWAISSKAGVRAAGAAALRRLRDPAPWRLGLLRLHPVGRPDVTHVDRRTQLRQGVRRHHVPQVVRER